MVTRCSRNLVVLGFVVAMFLTGTVNGGEVHSLAGILQGEDLPVENATITLTDAVTFSVITTTSSDAEGIFSFNVDEGIYHLFITPPAGSRYKGVIISDVRVIGKDVTQYVVLDSKNSFDEHRLLTSNQSQFALESVAANMTDTSEKVAQRMPVSDFMFLLPDCSVEMCD